MSELTGRDLDAAAAEKVMGRKIRFVKSEPTVIERDEKSPLGFKCNFGGAEFTSDREWLIDDWIDVEDNVEMAHYSTDIAAAWQVLEKMRERGLMPHFECFHDNQWRLYFFSDDGGCVGVGESPTAPEAICRAALAAVEHEKHGQKQEA